MTVLVGVRLWYHHHHFVWLPKYKSDKHPLSDISLERIPFCVHMNQTLMNTVGFISSDILR